MDVDSGVCVYVCVHSVMFDSAIPWTVIHQAPLSVGFSRQEYWRGLPFPTPGVDSGRDGQRGLLRWLTMNYK